MHFYCPCGNRISDTTDNIPHKAYLLPDQDKISYCAALEQIIQAEHLSVEEKLDQILVRLQGHYLSRCIYQCSCCGRLFVDDTSYNLHSFLPEAPIDKHLMASSKVCKDYEEIQARNLYGESKTNEET